ncbi:hypothetical protein AB0F81_30185 [Actinoplanes sp. NPDC024001]|uniref:TolB family protein n=1 Tax=Actinoplanes sp. NPDC024001 TaxID=3154598 RepID=UPI003411F714
MNAGEPPERADRIRAALAVLAATGAVLLVVGLAASVVGWLPLPPALFSGGGAEAADREPGGGTLPARIGAPSLWTADGERDPIGAASVLYTSNTWFFDGSDWFTGLVGKRSDTYRVLRRSGPAGMSSVLSPAGDRLATTEGVADLATGRFTSYPAELNELEIFPQAWSPDGRTLAILTDPEDVALRLLDVTTGEHRVVHPLSALSALHGWTAAFSPDGSRLAFQLEDRIRVVQADGGGEPVDYEIPEGARLAGKGAWQPDGRGLLVVAGEECDCGAYPIRWTVATVPLGAGPAPSWTVDGAFAVRVLGWWAGKPVAAEYSAVDGTTPALFTDEQSQWGLTTQDDIQSVRLVELGTGRVLLEPGGEAESIDVADSVLAAAATRAGDPVLIDADFPLEAPLVLLGVSTSALIVLRAGEWARRRRAGRPVDEAPVPER